MGVFKRFTLYIDGTPVRNNNRYKTLIDMAVEDYKGPIEVPEVVYSITDLEEYLFDFLQEVDCDCRCTVMFNKGCPCMMVYIFRNSKDYFVDALGFHVDISFKDLHKLDVPHLGDYIFSMWNAYSSVFIETEVKPS